MLESRLGLQTYVSANLRVKVKRLKMKQLSKIIFLGLSVLAIVACQPKDIDLDIESDPSQGAGSSSATGSSTEVGTLDSNSLESTESKPLLNSLGVEVDEKEEERRHREVNILFV